MNMNINQYNVNVVTRQGHHHIFEEKPNQDSFFLRRTDDFIIGIVADGCSMGDKSEVASRMLSRLCGEYTIHYIEKGYDFNYAVKEAYYDIVQYLRNSTFRIANEAAYMADMWLSTLLGFFISNEKAYIFHCGDGIYCIDGNFTRINQNNKPNYIAYAALTDPLSAGVNYFDIPVQFNVEEIPNFERLMISTDGFDNHKDCVKESLENQVWGKTGPQFVKWARMCSSKGYFNDDCTMIVVEKNENTGQD